VTKLFGNRYLRFESHLSATDTNKPRSPLSEAPPVSACPADISAGTSGPRGRRTAALCSLIGWFSPELCTLRIWYRALKLRIDRHLGKAEFEVALALRQHRAQMGRPALRSDLGASGVFEIRPARCGGTERRCLSAICARRRSTKSLIRGALPIGSRSRPRHHRATAKQ
jgi:hypothetical protein